MRGAAATALELATLVAGYLAFLWILLPAYRLPGAPAAIAVLAVAGGAWVCVVSPAVVHRDGLAARGLGPARRLWLRTDNLLPALRRMAPVAVAAALLLVAAGFVRPPEAATPASAARFLVLFARYVPFALVQDLALVFVLVRLEALAAAAGAPRPAHSGLAATAALFALVHAPNVAMMALGALFVVGAGAAFRSAPNLVVLVLCHAGAGAALRTLTGLSTRVGPFVERPDVWVTRELLGDALAALRGALP